jgi:hypothetical protein
LGYDKVTAKNKHLFQDPEYQGIKSFRKFISGRIKPSILLSPKFQISNPKFQEGLSKGLGFWFFDLGTLDFKGELEISHFE